MSSNISQTFVTDSCRGLIGSFEKFYKNGDMQNGLTIPTGKCISAEDGDCRSTLCNLDVPDVAITAVMNPSGPFMTNLTQNSCVQSTSEVLWTDGQTLVHLQGLLNIQARIGDAHTVAPDIGAIELRSTDAGATVRVARDNQFPSESALDLANCPGWEYGKYTCCKVWFMSILHLARSLTVSPVILADITYHLGRLHGSN